MRPISLPKPKRSGHGQLECLEPQENRQHDTSENPLHIQQLRRMVAKERDALRRIVHLIANGGRAKSIKQQDAAWKLLEDFNALDDETLVQRLAELRIHEVRDRTGRLLFAAFNFGKVEKREGLRK